MFSNGRARCAMIFALFVALAAGLARAQTGDYLSEDEQEQVRDAQDPSQRIGLYLSLAQLRLTRFDDYRDRPADPNYDVAGYLETQLDQYIHITDALKDWVADHFDRREDMRAGLKKVVEDGQRQIDELRRAEDSSDPYAAGYHKSVEDALDDFSDALDGATKALSEQSKIFGELKREEKADAQTIKDREKDEKKQSKVEGRLRKQEHEKGPPTDPDED